MRNALPLLAFMTCAAILEVWGDANIRKWAQDGRSIWFVPLGCLMLAAYGVVVNIVEWDLAKLLGIYVVFFAVTGVLWGKYARHEHVPWSTCLGLAFIIVGGVVIQWGPTWFKIVATGQK